MEIFFMFKLKEMINDKPLLKQISKLKIYGLLHRDFDNDKDELSISEMNEINSELKERWIK